MTTHGKGMTTHGVTGRGRARIVQRKRGETLEQEIFDAALALLEAEGSEAVSFSRVANAAHTSRSVLYRRWNTSYDLLLAALRSRLARGGRLSESNFDHGNLRDDLRALLNFLVGRIDTTDVDFIRLLFSRADSGEQLARTQDDLAQVDITAMDLIISRALSRKEIAHEPSELVKLLPFELIRSRIIMGSHHLDTTFIDSVVDEILLPLLVCVRETFSDT